MKKIILGILAIALLSGCSKYTAKIEVNPKDTKQSKYAPTNQQNQYGIVSYRNEGIGKEERREDAYKKMYTICDGKYKIVDEADKVVNTGYYSYGSYGKVLTDKIREIKFLCVK